MSTRVKKAEIEPRDIPKHPYSIFRRAHIRSERIMAALNRAILVGSEEQRDRLIKIYLQNHALQDKLIELMANNVIPNWWQERVH